MKKSLKIVLFFLLVVLCPFRAEAYFGYQILHLKCFSHPVGVGKFAVVNYHFGYEDCISEIHHYISIDDYYNLYVKDDAYKTDIDTLMIVSYMNEYEDGYLVKVNPIDEGYTFLGFVHSEYIGEQYDWWHYEFQHEDYPYYYRPEVNKEDFTFDVENAVFMDYHDAVFEHTDDKTIIHYAVDFWAGGFIREYYDNEAKQTYFPIDENTFPENPNDYCIGVFTRVFLTNEDRENVIIYPRANEIGDEVTLTCTRDDFDYWIEEGTGRHIEENPYTFTVTGKETYTAHFTDPSKIASHQLPSGKEGSSLIAHPSSVYDLQGRRLTKASAKGLYIQNGKKVIR